MSVLPFHRPAPSAPLTVVGVVIRVEQDGRIKETEFMGGFDEVRTQDAARACARAIGDGLGDELCRRLQCGEALRA